MAGNLAVRSFKKVTASLNGRLCIGFFEGDDVISVEENSDAGSAIVGAGGEVLFSDSADESAVVTLKFLESSPTHKYLFGLYNARRVDGVTPTFSFSFRDTVTGEGGSAAECKIMNRPSVASGTNAQVREWKIFAAQLEWNEIEFEG